MAIPPDRSEPENSSASHVREDRARGYYFTFWQLIRQPDGSYLATPHINIYPSAGLLEIINYPTSA